MALSRARRAALLAWAQRRGGVVVEDDYDADFRYDRLPLGAIAGLDSGPCRVPRFGQQDPGTRSACGLDVAAALAGRLGRGRHAARRGSEGSRPASLAELLWRGDYDRLRLSRAIAGYACTATEPDGTPTYSGVRDMSRIATDWKCWAIFQDSHLELVDQHSIELHDPDFEKIAKLWKLRPF